MSEAPHLLVDRRGGVLVATLNRPDKLNAISDAMMEALEAALHEFRDQAELKVMLIRATGRYFCAGADLRENRGGVGILPDTGSGIREMHRLKLRGMRRIYDEMEAIEKPIVAAHHAACMGGGLEMSLSCDFRLAAASASYAFPEGKFGVLPASNGVSRLTRIVGPHWARLLVMANLPATSQEALYMGLAHKVFPDETFEGDVMAFCRHLAQQMGTAKLAIEMATDVGLAQGRNVERLANSALMLLPAYQEMFTDHVAGIGGKG
jgi:enoyl-CoA hydratase